MRERTNVRGGLPAILPIVLHNGSSRWRAAEEMATLLRNVPDGLAQYRPQLRYLLIDEGSYDDADLACRGNLVAMLFRLEGCRYERLVDLVSELLERLRTSASDSLRRAFVAWLERVVLARMPCEIRSEVARLWEKPTMLSENIDRWEIEWEQGGARKLLERLLHKRFGALPEGVQTRLSGADINQLCLWSERLLDVGTLDEIFPSAALSR